MDMYDYQGRNRHGDLLRGSMESTSAQAVAATPTWAALGRGLRGLSHLRENPRDVAIIPLMALAVAGIALPIKVWAAFTMNRHGWLTRTDAERVQGQGEITGAARPAAPTVPAVRHAG